MREVVLCDDGVKITLHSNHHDAVLSIKKDGEVRFPLTRGNLAAILDGETIQFSHKGIFCKLSRRSENIRVVFAWKGTHDTALCPVADLEKLYEQLVPK